MNREQIERIKDDLMEEVVKRRKLGGYSQEASGILMIAEAVLHLTQHELDKMPLPKKKNENKG